MDDRKEPALQTLAGEGQAWDDSLVLTRYKFSQDHMWEDPNGAVVLYEEMQAYIKTLAAKNATLIARVAELEGALIAGGTE